MSKPLLVVACLVTTLVMALSGVGTAQAREAAAGPVYPPGAAPFKHGYRQVMADYLTWAYQVPADDNPVRHPDSPRNCEVHGDFVFLGGHGAGSKCVVPKGKAVAFGFAGSECSRAEGDGNSFAKLRRCARDGFAKSFSSAAYRFLMQVDGGLLAKPRRWTFTSANAVVDLPKKNILDAPAGRTKSVTRGLFYVLRPMKAGEHEVRVHGDDRKHGKFRYVYAFTVEK